VYGDFHDLQFATQSVDVIFCNAIDHAFDVHKILKEAARVLVPDGWLVLEVMRGTKEGVKPMFFESFGWATTDDLVPLAREDGFELSHRFPFSDYTYAGEQMYYRRRS
jgi:ubiquinone/menaquinone biosynthesis C-methylase UbiE